VYGKASNGTRAAGFRFQQAADLPDRDQRIEVVRGLGTAAIRQAVVVAAEVAAFDAGNEPGGNRS
jgi:hypothetical protein